MKFRNTSLNNQYIYKKINYLNLLILLNLINIIKININKHDNQYYLKEYNEF